MRTEDLRYRVDERYLALRGKILVHAGDNKEVARLAAYGDGVVLRGVAGLWTAASLPAETLKLVDREHYLSDRGSRQSQIFPETAEDAVEQQLRAGVACLLAPSRFPAQRDDQSIRTLLAAGQEFLEISQRMAPGKPAFVPVVIRFDELADRRWVEPVLDAKLPIATIFAGYGDPLGSLEQLRGAIELIQVAEVTLVLRCDLSVAGLMAYGATSGAIGVSSSVRHLYLPSKNKKRKPPSGYLFVPSLANWITTVFVERAAADPDLDELFHCACDVCGPEGDVRRLLLSGVDPDMLDQHSVAAAVMVARRVVRSPTPIDQWRAICWRADEAYARLRELGVVGPARPDVLGAWLDVLG
jgi:hypothetical protein